MATLVSNLSKEVLHTLDRWNLPVNPIDIAKDEEIQLAPGRYGDGFDARIEFLPEVKRFAIYYRPPGPGWSAGRVNFSIAHELGHFYIPHHRSQLLAGEMHNSMSDFRSKEVREQEADEFAANLLMPRELFTREVKQFRQRVCTLPEICQLADQRFGTSITSTARRYCQCDIEACSIVMSRNGIVSWAMHSEDMKALNMRFVQSGQRVPCQSKTAELWQAKQSQGYVEPVDGRVEPSIWFKKPYYDGLLWEDTMLLGNTGLAITLLTPNSD